RLGDPLERDSLLRQSLAERRSRLRAPAEGFQGPLGDTDQTHAMVDPSRPEAALRDFKTASLAEQEILRRHTHVAEFDLRVSMRRVVVAEDGQLAQLFD